MKNTKGITLIALIITIIIMLILVAVSISVALNTGLFKSAGDATKNWKSAQDAESKTQIEIGGKKYDSVEDYLEGKESIPEIHNWVRTGDDLTCTHCNKTYTIGQQVNYTAKGAGSSNISEEKSGITQAKANGKSWATDLGVQTIHKDDDTEWVVLGAESSNGDDGTNETLLLTTATPTTETITFYGAPAYSNGEDEINRMCQEIYGNEARGMKIEDVDNCFQYTAPAGICVSMNNGRIVGYFEVSANTKISDIEGIWRTLQSYSKYFTPNYLEGTSDSSVVGNEIVKGHYYFLSNDGTYLVNDTNENDTSNTITDVEKTVIFGKSNNYGYWLASNGICASSDFASYDIGYVSGKSAKSVYLGSEVFRSNGESFGGQEFSLRPVVLLRTDIPEVR